MAPKGRHRSPPLTPPRPREAAPSTAPKGRRQSPLTRCAALAPMHAARSFDASQGSASVAAAVRRSHDCPPLI